MLRPGTHLFLDIGVDQYAVGDIVVFHAKGLTTDLLKRVAAIAGDKIEATVIRNIFALKINDQPVVNSQGKLIDYGLHRTQLIAIIRRYEAKVPDDHVFVVGDQEWATNDSSLFGPISINSIYAKVRM